METTFQTFELTKDTVPSGVGIRFTLQDGTNVDLKFMRELTWLNKADREKAVDGFNRLCAVLNAAGLRQLA